MGDILIKGMKMPKDCGKCFVGDRTFCSSACPLVPVPPHGRLIDADAMEKLMSDTVQGDIRQYPYIDTQWELAFKWIDHQPTIIPASEEGK